jgi:hypothetical protein
MEDLSDNLNPVVLETESIRKETSLYKVQLAQQARKRSESNSSSGWDRSESNPLSGWDRSESERTLKDSSNILDVEYKKSVFQLCGPPEELKSNPNQETEEVEEEVSMGPNQDEGEADAGRGADETNDVRKLLFGEYPEPYPHSTGFQRIHVTSDDSQIDNETLYACKKLKECMFLRDKWLAQHPPPPQDSSDNSTVITSPLSSPASKKNVFRRRLQPVYDIFNQPLPTTCTDLRYHMVRGVMVVTRDDSEDVSKEKHSSTLHTIGVKYHSDKSLFPVLSFLEFMQDYRRVTHIYNHLSVVNISFSRLWNQLILYIHTVDAEVCL